MSKLLKTIALLIAIFMIASLAITACTTSVEEEKGNENEETQATTTTARQVELIDDDDDDDGGDDYESIPAETPLTWEDYKAFHNSHAQIDVIEVDSYLTENWGDGANENVIDGFDGFINEEDEATKIGASHWSPYPTIILTVDNAKAVAYGFVTGGDSDTYPQRSPNEWVFYGAEDLGGDWIELDVVRDGSVLAEGSSGFLYTIEESKQGNYNYYIFEAYSSVTGNFDGFQLNEFYLYAE